MPHRSPTAADIGKTVDFSLDGHQWHTAKLSSIDYDETGPLFWQNIEGRHRFFNHCRVPYSCPDPIAELSMAADLLAERGAPEAARVLLLWLSMSDRDRERLNNYQPGDSVSVFRTLLDELTGRRSWRSVQLLRPEPEPQP